MAKNFELVKKAIYQNIVKKPEFSFSFLGGSFSHFHKKKEDGIKELNKIIDAIDIRAVSIILKNHPDIKVPKWIKTNSFVIDYNSKSELDLIRI